MSTAPSSTPLIGETIGQSSAPRRRRRGRSGRRSSPVTRSVRWTYAELLRRSEDLAVGLRALGLRKGDRIGIWSANVSEWVLAQFGTALAGLILVNINPAYRAHEFEYAMKKSGCRALILSAGHKNNDYFACPARLRARDRRGPTRASSRPRACPSSKSSSVWGRTRSPGMLNFDEVAKPADGGRARRARDLRRDRCSSTIRSTSSSRREPPARRRARR